MLDDLVNDQTFSSRTDTLGALLRHNQNPYLVPVYTQLVNNIEEALAAQGMFIEQGYEGAMIRNVNGMYEGGKRSANLQKMKSFEDAEYEIVGANEGRGKDSGTVGSFICKIESGQTFSARLQGPYATRKKLFEQGGYIGQLLTVKYQNLTSDNLPRFPIGKGLRIKGM